MQIKINDPASIGQIVRACRKSQKVRQDDAADSIGVSENFLGKVEAGSDSVHWGKLFQVLSGMGVHVILDVPESVGLALNNQNDANKKP